MKSILNYINQLTFISFGKKRPLCFHQSYQQASTNFGEYASGNMHSISICKYSINRYIVDYNCANIHYNLLNSP